MDRLVQGGKRYVDIEPLFVCLANRGNRNETLQVRCLELSWWQRKPSPKMLRHVRRS